ncbi:pentapeptide repeat-containing protein, partial [Amaricoccus sp.]|uniref:pentapeptide repeat-containing protein n=2 Tax=Amaricoccus sp. TaxID=1872485 RepID=UPI002C279A2F
MPADPEEKAKRTEAQIERINQVSAMARTSWIALLGYLAFVGVTLLGVEDADFFVPSRQTQLPLVDVSIPTASFFLFAPILATALYVYLHIILLKLWDAIADLTEPTTADGQPVGDALVPWLVNDWALSVRGGPFLPARPLRGLGNLASFLLVWAATPLALYFFWLWSMPAHRPFLTLFLAACFLIALAAGITGWQTAHAWLSGNRPPPSEHPPLWTALRELLRRRHPARVRILAAALRDSLRRHAGLWALGLLLAYVSLVRTAWPTADQPPLARANVSNVELVDLPAGWRDWETARTAFRETWCKREGLDMAVCGQPRGPGADPLPRQAAHDRREWCLVHEIAACDRIFADLDTDFAEDWRTERASAIADLPQLDLRGRDLRNIVGENVTLVGARLAGARLEGAYLSGARLEGANLSEARLEGANL